MTSEIPDIKTGHTAKCIRCERVIYNNSACHPSAMLALCLSALIISVPAFNQPLISLHLLSITEDTNLIQGALMMIDIAPIVSFVVLFCAVIAPTMLIISIAISSACLTFQYKPSFLPKIFKITRHLIHWSMLEVYMVSLMVAMFKLMNYADLYIGFGFYFFIALLLLNMMIISNYSNHQYWEKYNNL
ncbi:hypothetical protein GCM10007916_23890 [Psychromonas marina]|uniref:Paraquat-inducible protein A n=2 Tax=Psychromonas marina TaxID=88364 RepID=A0ABQ6E2A2_9GAMM|nr:hypothetical protein GCM10007916_23890 [Psychromonas marina]